MASVESNHGFVLGWTALLALLGLAILVAALGHFSAPEAASVIGLAVGAGLLVAAPLATRRERARLPARYSLTAAGAFVLVASVAGALVAFDVLEAALAVGLGVVALAVVLLLLHHVRRRS